MFWEVRYSRENFESLSVEFNSENQVVRINGRHGRFCWGEVAGNELWVDHWNKVQTFGYPVTSSWEIPSPLIPVQNLQPPNKAQEVSMAISRCLWSFYRRTGHWPGNVEDIKGENAWLALRPDQMDYHSIRFAPEREGKLKVTIVTSGGSRNFTVLPPKTKDAH